MKSTSLNSDLRTVMLPSRCRSHCKVLFQMSVYSKTPATCNVHDCLTTLLNPIAKKHSSTLVCTYANTLPAPRSLTMTLQLIAFCFSCFLGASALICCRYDALCFRNMARAICQMQASIRGRRSRYIKARAYRSLRFSRRRILIVFSFAYILTYFMMIESASGRHPMLPYSWTEKRFRRRKNSKHCPRCVKNVAQNIDSALYRLKDEMKQMWTHLVNELSNYIIPSQWPSKLWSAHIFAYAMYWSMILCNGYTNQHTVFPTSLLNVNCCASIMTIVNHTCIALTTILIETLHFAMPMATWISIGLYCHARDHVINCCISSWTASLSSWNWSILTLARIYSAALLIPAYATIFSYNLLKYFIPSTLAGLSTLIHLITLWGIVEMHGHTHVEYNDISLAANLFRAIEYSSVCISITALFSSSSLLLDVVTPQSLQFLLALCGDVHPNPGPCKSKKSKTTNKKQMQKILP
jgi:hypothetical protein